MLQNHENIMDRTNVRVGFSEKPQSSVATYVDPKTFQTLNAEFRLITPEIAKSMLAATEKVGFQNRNLRRSKVEMYTRDLQNGVWKLTNQSIGVLYNGAVIDGQHRLHAIVRSGLAVRCLVVSGLSADVFPFIDIGAPRTLADAIKNDQQAYSTNLAAAGKLLAAFDTGNITTHQTPSNQEALQSLERHPVAQEWVNILGPHRNVNRYARRAMATVVTVLAEERLKTDRQELERFWDILLERSMPDSMQSIIVAYRKRLGTPADRKGLSANEQMIAFSHALLGFIQGKEVSNFVIPKKLPTFLT